MSALKGRSYAPSTWDVIPSSEKEWVSDLDTKFEKFLCKIKAIQFKSATELSKGVANLLKSYVEHAPPTTECRFLIILFTAIGYKLTETVPIELVLGNICRRVIFFIRQECAAYGRKGEGSVVRDVSEIDMSLSLMRLIDTQVDFTIIPLQNIKDALILSFQELHEELNSVGSITDQSVDHIYSNEFLLTFGYSHLVLKFLKNAHSGGRKFEVYVCEGGAAMSGAKMASELAELGVSATLVPDSVAYALMPSISKVLIGTHAVVANGGLVSHAGGFGVCAAAKAHGVPVVVLSGLHKLCPRYAFNHETFNEHLAPAEFLQFDQVLEGRVDVINPGFDYVPPDYVSLFVTNSGTYQPSYIYRLITEYYSILDHDLKIRPEHVLRNADDEEKK